ncbi:hypothetical protein K501DRAFT_266541 [Backusella circina FSU 941]|nr:hypothetical protein K501DRAFT_266541 [Backusella circina FSU 941]
MRQALRSSSQFQKFLKFLFRPNEATSSITEELKDTNPLASPARSVATTKFFTHNQTTTTKLTITDTPKTSPPTTSTETQIVTLTTTTFLAIDPTTNKIDKIIEVSELDGTTMTLDMLVKQISGYMNNPIRGSLLS